MQERFLIELFGTTLKIRCLRKSSLPKSVYVFWREQSQFCGPLNHLTTQSVCGSWIFYSVALGITAPTSTHTHTHTHTKFHCKRICTIEFIEAIELRKCLYIFHALLRRHIACCFFFLSFFLSALLSIPEEKHLHFTSEKYIYLYIWIFIQIHSDK